MQKAPPQTQEQTQEYVPLEGDIAREVVGPTGHAILRKYSNGQWGEPISWPARGLDGEHKQVGQLHPNHYGRMTTYYRHYSCCQAPQEQVATEPEPA